MLMVKQRHIENLILGEKGGNSRKKLTTKSFCSNTLLFYLYDFGGRG